MPDREALVDETMIASWHIGLRWPYSLVVVSPRRRDAGELVREIAPSYHACTTRFRE
jgi:hypothetical protein